MTILLGILLLGGALGLLGARAEGGRGFRHQLQPGTAAVVQQCEGAPADGREHVHVFFINGADPFCIGNLNGLAGRLRTMGYHNTHFRQCWQCRSICGEVAYIRQQDPDAKIMLVGFSYGALKARKMAQTLGNENIWVDSLVYLAGDFIKNTPASTPRNVGHVVNLQAHGYVWTGYDLFFNGQDLPNAQNQRVDAMHMDLPARTETTDALATELAGLAQQAHTSLAARNTQQPALAGTPAPKTGTQATTTSVPVRR